MKNWLKYMVIVLVVLIVGGIIYWWVTNNRSVESGVPVNFSLIDRSNYGLYSDALEEDSQVYKDISVVVVDNDADWKRFWESSIRNIGTGGFDSLPAVDWNANVVLAILQGVKPTGGYYLSTESVVTMSNGLLINMKIVEPAETDGLSQAISSPYEVISVPRVEAIGLKGAKIRVVNVSDGAVVFEKPYQDLVYHTN
ncbi:MAG: protease complex subunit PrcB family protein [Patescibacteria group bacterium]